MSSPRSAPLLAALAGAIALCAMAVPAAAQSGPELYADANRLNREGLYWAALLRYEQAIDSGFESPLLYYNRGVAHYRARQFTAAREAFERAGREPALAALAQYNLGLTAMAAGDENRAALHFGRVSDQSARPELAELAGLALESLADRRAARAVQATPEADEETPVAIVESDRPSGFYVSAELGVGSDDNVFRSPDIDYVDRSQAGNPVVSPDGQSGVYYPVDVAVTYAVGSFENEAFFGRYRLAGRYYQDAKLDNANEYSHELAFGSTYHRRSENRERKIYSAFSVARHDETWFDPDDGTERVENGELVGERLSYTRYGPEVWARQSFNRLSFNVYGKGRILNYDSPTDLPEYDHEYLRGGLSAQFRFTSTSLIRVEGDYWQRRFGSRPSFDLDGTQPIDNPAVRYTYLNYGATARQRVTRWFWFGLRYARTERTDEHVGYNDYLRDGYGAEFSLRISDRFKLRAEGWYHNYNYVRAFAYHDPAAGRKTLESATGILSARWQLTNDLALVASYEHDEFASNDRRIDYMRGQFMLGLRWQP